MGNLFIEVNMDSERKELPRGCMVAGYRRTFRGIRAGQIRCVLLACDADADLTDKVRSLCAESGLPVITVATKREMGIELGLDVDCAVCGISRE